MNHDHAAARIDDRAKTSKLKRLQRWLQTVITHPQGVVAGVNSGGARQEVDVRSEEVEQVIAPSKALSSIERLNVYGNAYVARLVGCLHDEFPALVHAIGKEAFDGLAFGYVHAHPSHSYSLADLGADFPDYLAQTRPSGAAVDWAGFIIDLAQLERTYAEVFDGPGTEQVRDELKLPDQVPVERMAEMRLIPAPCLRLRRFAFAVHEYATAVRRRQQPQIPEPKPTYLAITRRDYIVRRAAVTRTQFELLQGIVNGATLGVSIRRAVEYTDADIDQMSASLDAWFRHWTTAGYFTGVDQRLTFS